MVLQKKGFKFSPITALYYIAPAVVPFLLSVAVAKVKATRRSAAVGPQGPKRRTLPVTPNAPPSPPASHERTHATAEGCLKTGAKDLC